jgi:hypothetical protein
LVTYIFLDLINTLTEQSTVGNTVAFGRDQSCRLLGLHACSMSDSDFGMKNENEKYVAISACGTKTEAVF